MPAILSLFVVLVLSILVTRVASVALAHTGLSREVARFQARSAFTGVGFTTSETERVVNHPVRRRIVMLLMLLGNAGLVSAVSSLVLTFVDSGAGGMASWKRALVIVGGVAVLGALAWSPLLGRWLSSVISWALNRWTRLDTRDYASLLHLAGAYQVHELAVREGDWLAGRRLRGLALTEEGILVLGVQRTDGRYVGAPTGETRIVAGDVLLLYGRDEDLRELDARGSGAAGDREHDEAVAEQRRVVAEQEAEERASEERGSREA